MEAPRQAGAEGGREGDGVRDRGREGERERGREGGRSGRREGRRDLDLGLAERCAVSCPEAARKLREEGAQRRVSCTQTDITHAQTTTTQRDPPNAWAQVPCNQRDRRRRGPQCHVRRTPTNADRARATTTPRDPPCAPVPYEQQNSDKRGPDEEEEGEPAGSVPSTACGAGDLYPSVDLPCLTCTRENVCCSAHGGPVVEAPNMSPRDPIVALRHLSGIFQAQAHCPLPFSDLAELGGDTHAHETKSTGGREHPPPSLSSRRLGEVGPSFGHAKLEIVPLSHRGREVTVPLEADVCQTCRETGGEKAAVPREGRWVLF